MEIAQLAPDEAVLFLAEYGLQAPSLQRVIRMCYDLLNRQAFFTVGEDEVRAWTINNGASAPQASGAIHSDLEAGFIRAEVMAYADLHQHGSEAAVKTAGKWRLEGREYTVQDGDILQVRFSPPSKK
jgi:ribosome-binding ATPase YchF (GTP1/OBG family)